jgi:hypothetical protein
MICIMRVRNIKVEKLQIIKMIAHVYVCDLTSCLHKLRLTI